MNTETQIRSYVHQLVDKVDIDKLRAIVTLIGDEYFSEEECNEIQNLRNSNEWTDWRSVRSDV